jgi:hypothetical protein
MKKNQMLLGEVIDRCREDRALTGVSFPVIDAVTSIALEHLFGALCPRECVPLTIGDLIAGQFDYCEVGRSWVPIDAMTSKTILDKHGENELSLCKRCLNEGRR